MPVEKGRMVIVVEAIILAVSMLVLSLTGEWAPATWIRHRGIPMNMTPLVVIDAGHGGMDGGALGVRGVKESPLNLAVAKLVESRLIEKGYRVMMTRNDENALGKSKRADMQMRRKIMREDDVSVIVSIHMNKFRDSSVKGPRVFYMEGSKQGELLATQIVTTLCASIEYPRRLASTGNYFVLRESIAPAVIVECGFLSNASDAKKLQDPAYQQKLAEGIVNGLVAYFACDPEAVTN